jgi:sphingomyelin phosphodiesterase acid-like 3
MKLDRTMGVFTAVSGSSILLAFLLLAATACPAQASHKAPPKAVEGAIPALFLSDIHFEPFADPGKVAQLAAAPVSQWNGILAAAPSADREQQVATLNQSCKTRGSDTSYVLLQSSLQAMRVHAAGVKFVTVSGDLIAHSFSCKYDALFPHAAAGDYRGFVEKTVEYVSAELAATFPGIPVYLALGNNDSDCGDYRLDAHSEFLSVTGKVFASGFPAKDRQAAQEDFAGGGFYSVQLPAPMRNARLLVLDDLFWAKKYKTCAGQVDSTAADVQLAWLAAQLAEARRNKQKVWVMSHIPPGVDVHGTITKNRDVCGGKSPEMFLSSEKMAEELAEFGDVVALGIFAHTHMDEMRLLPATQPEAPAARSAVVLKMVPSISPIDGNAPSFTVASIDPASAALVDYRVYVASNQTGVDAQWKQEYDYAETYHQPSYTADSVGKLLAGFQADPGMQNETSRAYIRNFFSGGGSPALGLVWPQYGCGLSNDSADGYRACVCPAAH